MIGRPGPVQAGPGSGRKALTELKMNKAELVAINNMPDVAAHELQMPHVTLDWVGMSGIHQPLLIKDGDRINRAQAVVQIYVDLGDELAKGIHMSRLYLILDEHSETRPLTTAGLKLLLRSMLESHRDLSSRAFVQFDFNYYLRRPALVSDNSGWNAYPVSIRGELKDGEIELELKINVQYSSTCPCSAALARQLIQQQFEADFGTRGDVPVEQVAAWLGTEQGIVATPHSQDPGPDRGEAGGRAAVRAAERSEPDVHRGRGAQAEGQPGAGSAPE